MNLRIHDIIPGTLDQLADPRGIPTEDAGEEGHAHALEAMGHIASEEGGELLVAGALHPGVEADVLAGLDDVDKAYFLQPTSVVRGARGE